MTFAAYDARGENLRNDSFDQEVCDESVFISAGE
jgi:hypothetical protein